MKMQFDRFSLIDFSIFSVNCSHLCIIYVKVFEKILSGGLEVSFSIVLRPEVKVTVIQKQCVTLQPKYVFTH